MGTLDPAVTYPAPDQATVLYAWGNTHAGNPTGVNIRSGHEHLFQEGRDFFNTEMPGYTPYTYPHPLTAEPTLAVPVEWQSKADFSNGVYSLGAGNTGSLLTRFDFRLESADTGFIIGYADTQTDVSGEEDLIVDIRAKDGKFVAVNGDAHETVSEVVYDTGEEVYSVKMLINLDTQTYDAWITPPGGSETQLAENYAFRPGTTADDLGKICLYSTGDGDFTVIDHTVVAYSPAVEIIGDWYSVNSFRSEGLHNLGEPGIGYTGQVRMSFISYPMPSRSTALSDTVRNDTVIADYTHMSFMIRAYTNGLFDAYNTILPIRK